MTGAESRVVSGFLEAIVQVSVNDEFAPFLEGNLVTADRPVHFGFLASVEPVDIDKCTVTTAESFPQDCFVGEGTFQNGHVIESEQVLSSSGSGVAAEESNGVFLVGD